MRRGGGSLGAVVVTAAAGMAAAAAAIGTVGVAEVVGGRRPRGERGVLRRLTVLARRRGGGSRGAAPDVQVRLDAAGLAIDGADFALLRGVAAVAALLLVLPLAWAAPGRGGLVILLAAPAAGHLAPAAWLARRTRRRAARIESELADVLDLLRVALAAGLTPMRALGEVGRRHPGLLAGEFARAAARRALGVPAAAVLGDLQQRAPGEGIAALCAALGRAERHGAPLAAALAAQAHDARSRAASRTAEAAARAAPRIQLVVALGLVPAVLALVAAALLPALDGW